MKIQLISDIHINTFLEHKSLLDILTPCADVLCVAGDVGDPTLPSYHLFLRECHQAFKHVIIVPGNHEYHDASPNTMIDIDMFLSSTCKLLGNVHYLAHGDNVVVDDVNFIGATLWPLISNNHFDNYQLKLIDDYLSRISKNNTCKWSIESSNIAHECHVRNIELGLGYGMTHNLKNVVVTHYSPILDYVYDEYHKYRSLLGTELKHMMNCTWMHAWLYGNTYNSNVALENGVLLASNQYTTLDYNKMFVFEI